MSSASYHFLISKAMKPRNKTEQMVVELSAKLPNITEKQKQWAKDTCFEKIGYYNKGEVWCMSCGRVHEKMSSLLGIDIVGDETVCPHCGTHLKLVNSRKRKSTESWYFTIATTCRGFQVFRHFIIERAMYKVSGYIVGGHEPYFSINEAVQNWISEDGREYVMARPCKCIPHVYDAWNFKKPMSIKDKGSGRLRYSYSPDKYDVNAAFTYPIRRVIPKLKRNGFTFRCNRVSASSLAVMLLTDNEAEMLIKTKQYDLLYAKSVRGIPQDIKPSINICNRNGYKVRDASLWMDYIHMLQHFNMDTRNAKYVCPADLKKEHDKLLKRRNREEARQREIARIREAQGWENTYVKEKGRFFGICFGNENLIITVVQSVAEMAEEGKAMHHCVFACGYYKKKESLILSAKDKEGNRIETIEVNLKTFKVVQSRAVCNEMSQYHDQIIDLVNRNMNQIKRRAVA